MHPAAQTLPRLLLPGGQGSWGLLRSHKWSPCDCAASDREHLGARPSSKTSSDLLGQGPTAFPTHQCPQGLSQCLLNEQVIFLNVTGDGVPAGLTLPPWRPTPSKIKAGLPRPCAPGLADISHLIFAMVPRLSPPNSDQEFHISKPWDLSHHSCCEQTRTSFQSLSRTFL